MSLYTLLCSIFYIILFFYLIGQNNMVSISHRTNLFYTPPPTLAYIIMHLQNEYRSSLSYTVYSTDPRPIDWYIEHSWRQSIVARWYQVGNNIGSESQGPRLNTTLHPKQRNNYNVIKKIASIPINVSVCLWKWKWI